MTDVPSAAQLVSLAASLDELRARLSAHAEAASTGGAEGVALELFEVERTLAAARRRLTRAVKAAR